MYKLLAGNITDYLKNNGKYLIIVSIVLIVSAAVVILLRILNTKKEKLMNDAVTDYIDKLSDENKDDYKEECQDGDLADEMLITESAKTSQSETVIKEVILKEEIKEDIIENNKENTIEPDQTEENIIIEKVAETNEDTIKGFWQITDKNKEVFCAQLFLSDGILLLTAKETLEKSSALKSIDTIRKNCLENNFIIKENSNKFYFKIIALNKRVLATSPEFENEAICRENIDIIKKLVLSEII